MSRAEISRRISRQKPLSIFAADCVPVLVAAGLAVGCADGGEPAGGGEGDGGADNAGASVTAYEAARVITGDGEVIAPGVFLVGDGRFAGVGASGDIEIPTDAARVDLGDKTVMPAVVNAHIHLSSDRAERTEQLEHMAYYGTGAAVSLGLDSGSVAFEMREDPVPGGVRTRTAGRGITMPEPGRSQVTYWIESADQARAAVQELAAREVDIVKIWVDDRGGRYDRLSPGLYGAIIDEAHQNGLMVTAHVFYLEDAKGLLRAGIDVFAHGVRDLDADDELLALWAERPDVVLVPNLPDPGVARDLGWLSGTVPADQLAEMQAASVERPGAGESFGIQARNLVRFNEAGVKIAFGTDGSAAWAVHQEMADMVRAGMSPADVIVAATKSSADLMGWSEVGAIEVGRSADFIVLAANPLEDIANTKRIDEVYLGGVQVDREAIGARLRARP